MAKTNAYLSKKRVEKQVLLDIGAEFGAQKVIDYLTLVLRDPEYVGSDIFGRERIDRVISGIAAYDKEFARAYDAKDTEADVFQERLDRLLREVYEEELVPFAERQPHILKPSYKPRKEWVQD